MADDDLDKAAARGARRREHQAEKERRRASQPTKEERERKAVLARSLRGPVLIWVIRGLIFGPFVWVPSLAFIAVGPLPGEIVPAIFGGWLVAFLLIPFGSHVSNPIQWLWLRSLALPLDLAGYERVMGTPRFPSGRLVVTVRFQQAPAPEEQRRVADAVMGMLRGSSAKALANELVIESPSMQTHYYARGGGFGSNEKLHAWFKTCARRALRRIHARHPLASVSFDLT